LVTDGSRVYFVVRVCHRWNLRDFRGKAENIQRTPTPLTTLEYLICRPTYTQFLMANSCMREKDCVCGIGRCMAERRGALGRDGEGGSLVAKRRHDRVVRGETILITDTQRWGASESRYSVAPRFACR